MRTLVSSSYERGHLCHALEFFNQGLDELEFRHSLVDAAELFAKGLNKIQTEWVLARQRDPLGEIGGFKEMAKSQINGDAREVFLSSPELAALVSFEPKVRNQDVLNRKGHIPGTTLEGAVLNAATEKHRLLCTSFHKLREDRSPGVEDQVIERSAELLYIVRSNIAHGEKTANGLDLEKAIRDEDVCAVVIPLQRLIFELLLGSSGNALVVYGTLAPGEVSDSVLQGMEGQWEYCKVRGRINTAAGLSVLVWNPTGEEIRANLFKSGQLKENWNRLDRFEGSRYKRRLVSVQTATGAAIAYAYLAA